MSKNSVMRTCSNYSGMKYLWQVPLKSVNKRESANKENYECKDVRKDSP